MFLKSIEIRGFKSFADKTELLFKRGVTGIVGPNGSGKSNISDAVRWVLGEQSVKSLRGSKMEDVIFAGTQFRKPVGVSQVSLILDNNDKELDMEYSEVIITRRLYRSGDSEYYINNTKCRLKDIQELFMDTGIGKEGYSIIGQGKIDAVLSGRPEERRSLLEEAAGIVKFKSRKDEATKRLLNTDENLVRIEDILNTYSERLEPLKNDSEKAKVFIDLSNSLKEKEINLIVYSIENINKKLEEINEKFNLSKEKIDELKKEKDKYKEDTERLTSELEKLDKNNSLSKEKYYNKKDLCKDLESENILISEKMKNIQKDILEREEEFKSNENKLKNYIEEKEKLEKIIKNIKEKSDEIKFSIENSEKNILDFNEFYKDKSNRLNKLKENQIDIVSDISNTRNDIAILKNDMKNIQNKLEQIESSCKTYLNSININLKTKLEIEKQIENINKNIDNLKNNLERNCKEISSIKISLSSKEKKLKQTTSETNRLEANYQMLSNLEKHYEGYNRSVKVLMEHISKDRIKDSKGKCEVLGKVIKVEKHLEKAMEIALGGYISNIITKDEFIAKNLINYLKSNNLGRATFLPLTTIKGKKLNLNNNILNYKGFIGIASDLIKYNDRFSNIIDYVLGRTIVVKDMDSALHVSKIMKFSCKVVTIEGEVVNPGGSLTGGSFRKKSGSSIISRKREIEEISMKVKSSKEEIEILSKNISQRRNELKILDEENLNIKDEVYKDNIEVTKLQSKLMSIRENTDTLKSNLRVSKKEVELIESDINSTEVNIKKEENKLNELIKNKEINEKNIDSLEKLINEKNKTIKDSEEKLTELKIKNAQLKENIDSKSKDFNNIQKDIKELQNNQSDILVKNKRDNATIEDYKNNIINNKKEIDSIKNSIENLESSFKEYEVYRIKLKDNLEKYKNKEESIGLIFQNKEQEVHKQELQITKHKTEKESFYNKLNEEFSLTYAEALSFKKDILDIVKYKSEVSSLKSKITSLGNVNLGAIEEYKELNEKITFMNNQKEDLVKSKEELQNVIDEMTKKMRTVFSENFNKLNRYFNETFRQLFKGGSGNLILNGEDELTCNIDINVQPPGKKLQNINLMSGGEKGLSAIALLFAILKMKPTPFCILDEIEAALDDANVIRYGEFLKEFSEKIQFIVITHRKGTMEACDALYGVTMEEKGVSKLISVDLTARKEAAVTS